MAKITMEEISKMAGVSLATVSRTVHSPQLVRKETRERINRVMKNVNYVYHATAGDLSRNRSSIIGVIIPAAKNLVFSTTLFAIQETAQEKYFSLITGSSKYDIETELRLLQRHVIWECEFRRISLWQVLTILKSPVIVIHRYIFY